MPTLRLDPDHTALLLVDLQDRLVRVMPDPEALIGRARLLTQAAAGLELPVLVTEQYPRGLGPTVPELVEHLPTNVCRSEKTCFTACTDAVRGELRRLGVCSVIVAGIEAHVCVLQTCLALVDAGYVTAVALDATSSQRPEDKQIAMHRMIQAGVIPTTVESALLELVGDAGDPRFKAMLPLLKE